MADELNAIPDLLSHVGNELATHGQSLLALHLTCHRDADDARSGWVGASAGALSELLDRWHAASAGHQARFGQHARGLSVAAARLSEMESHNAGVVSRP